MKDWVGRLDSFLRFNERAILNGVGKISHEVAEALALGELGKYRAAQDKVYISDFDRFIGQDYYGRLLDAAGSSLAPATPPNSPE